MVNSNNALVRDLSRIYFSDHLVFHIEVVSFLIATFYGFSNILYITGGVTIS